MTTTKREFYVYRRHLPHWRSRGRLYFVTWRLDRRQSDLRLEERECVVNSLKHFDGERYELWGYVVMNDHVHVLVWPEDTYLLEEIIHSWKSYTARRLQQEYGRVGQVWQHESFDRIVRNEKELYEKASYIFNNAFDRWPELSDYRWMWVKGT